MRHLLEAVPANCLPTAREQDRAFALFRGPSEAINRMWSRMRSVDPSFKVLLIRGEAGSCPDTVAHLLHSFSSHRSGDLLKLEPGTAERRLRNPRRLLRTMTGGVLYLSDVDRLSAAAQEDLRRLMRLNRHNCCALIAHVSHNLLSLAALGCFSVPLAQDLSTFDVQIPSLRERSQDIPYLAEFLLREACSAAGISTPAIADSFLQEALSFRWPENLDQFRSVMLLLSSRPHGGELNADDLRAALEELYRRPAYSEVGTARMIRLDLVVREHVGSVLAACQGNKLQASEVLGISRSTIYRILAAS